MVFFSRIRIGREQKGKTEKNEMDVSWRFLTDCFVHPVSIEGEGEGGVSFLIDSKGLTTDFDCCSDSHYQVSSEPADLRLYNHRKVQIFSCMAGKMRKSRIIDTSLSDNEIEGRIVSSVFCGIAQRFWCAFGSLYRLSVQ